MNKKSGFTLIEILLVIVILSVLTVGSIFGIDKIQKKSEEKAMKELYETIEEATDTYISQYDGYVKEILNGSMTEKCTRLYTLQNEGLLNFDLVNPKTKKTISENACVISYLNEKGEIVNFFDIDNTLRSTRIEVKVNHGISDRNVKYAFRTAIFNITPDNGYIVSSVTCDNGAVGNVDGNKVIITNFNKNQTCEVITSLNSPGENSTLVDAIKYYNSRVSTRTEFNAPFYKNTINTIYEGEENSKVVYYFSGIDTETVKINNWVKFGGFYWRIIRTNSDGSVRLIYSGQNENDENDFISKDCYYKDTNGNCLKNNVDYFHYNTSNIKSILNTWFNNNLSSYNSYISTTANFCNDTTSMYTSNGKIYYGAYQRLQGYSLINGEWLNNEDNIKPNYNCTGSNLISNQSVGLINADEIVFAGGKVFTTIENIKFWFTGSGEYYTMSPFSYNGSNDVMFTVTTDRLSTNYISEKLNIRPVINLKANVKWVRGTGKRDYPFEVSL